LTTLSLADSSFEPFVRSRMMFTYFALGFAGSVAFTGSGALTASGAFTGSVLLITLVSSFFSVL